MKRSLSASEILYQLEHPETIDGSKPTISTRDTLSRAEEKALSGWKIPEDKKKLAGQGSSSSVGKRVQSRSALDLSLQEGTTSPRADDDNQKLSPTAKQWPKGIGIPLHMRGFSISERPPLESFLGVNNKFPGNGPGKYDTDVVGSMTWDKNGDVSNPAQKQLSQHKTPKRVFFGKSQASIAARKQLLSQAPGPGHYTKPDLWDPAWQRFPPMGTTFVRKPPAPGESRFGGLARGLVKSGGDLLS